MFQTSLSGCLTLFAKAVSEGYYDKRNNCHLWWAIIELAVVARKMLFHYS